MLSVLQRSPTTSCKEASEVWSQQGGQLLPLMPQCNLWALMMRPSLQDHFAQLLQPWVMAKCFKHPAEGPTWQGLRFLLCTCLLALNDTTSSASPGE